MSEAEMFQAHVEKWLNHCKDYPSKAVLTVALAVLKEQEKRIDQNRGQLDSSAWSPNAWS
ncbi:hypothetical protein [Facklamia miroungae]|uniref:Uncharacterized protein n=1 Tax=Facklamia miroungae TaxID=120956 RepID=A0A1G7RQ65_9LACT|nr:hypothetical protein [Facklamia miroungae]NKZ29318.1 hypothetical protein [Facklamia miroungae]SDG12947.1 hypothetical protein SAMN05421791_103136 [Facklamia miroungae]